jgi:hypothetical protein
LKNILNVPQKYYDQDSHKVDLRLKNASNVLRVSLSFKNYPDVLRAFLEFQYYPDVLGAFLKIKFYPDVLRALPNLKSCLFNDLRFSPENLPLPGCPQSVVNQYVLYPFITFWLECVATTPFNV